MIKGLDTSVLYLNWMNKYCFCFVKFIICFPKNGRRKSIQFDRNANELLLWINGIVCTKFFLKITFEIWKILNLLKRSLDQEHFVDLIFSPTILYTTCQVPFMRLIIVVLRKIKPNQARGILFFYSSVSHFVLDVVKIFYTFYCFVQRIRWQRVC